MNKYNVIVEGETDSFYISKVLSIISKSAQCSEVFPILSSGDVSFLDQGGVSNLAGFVKSTYEFIIKERPCIIVLDGDNAGQKVQRELQGYLGNKKIPFKSNEDFIFVYKNFAIEGLFPEVWLKEYHNSHPDLFKEFSLDSCDNLTVFELKDDKKKKFMEMILKKAEEQKEMDWASNWIKFLNVLEKSLEKQGNRIYGKKP
ncbi:hypothetical protein [Acetobacter pasteurianus]|uniref:DUF4435 domain-containing protein n=1 Tax=Acetobacter pasteurianus (strain NBRC 105184 / IFO 3283-01) TaxID=634452 RepID=C7JCH3_ACEP3|nr:hypothetical protein [Acetobacter pasteurianus]AKR47571.1 hypothetical protein DB34_00275 [Acetobacter pasteurianus]BAI00002.1 hypothetical protein APA01_18760 [Acetobacter pasteurianus IFO 3283-01]BAI03055.1 hypothetical protein APA03_18760 [Acetobacter pasteurianus IFO 3283-03]BAI06100.1 hypothetical protein APA07_18760 [Acetobacter pasteurianus IFO 3283-07]BAI09150.1 hypothetical protein APA22_18760 [Acetobacter pasteurianus IFO 3283-22]